MSSQVTDIAEVVQPVQEHFPAPADPCAIVIFGASGDLARRKLIPALYDLAAHESLAPRFAIIGFARTPMNDEAFRAAVAEAARKNPDTTALDEGKWNPFSQCLGYVSGEYYQPEGFQRLAARLTEIDRACNLGGNRLFYLATPPEVYLPIIEQ